MRNAGASWPFILVLAGLAPACAFWDMGDWGSGSPSITPDAAVTDAASTDAAFDAGSTSAGHCPTNAVFCDDFESDDAGWDSVHQDSPAGTITVSTTQSSSPTRSLFLQVNPGAASAAPYYDKKFFDVPSRIQVDFDIYLDTIGPNGLGTFGQISSTNGTRSVDLTLRILGGAMTYHAEADNDHPGMDYALRRPLKTKTWEHVTIALRIDIHTVRIQFGNDVALAESATPALFPDTIEMIGGSTFVSPPTGTSTTESWGVYFDNYAMTYVQ